MYYTFRKVKNSYLCTETVFGRKVLDHKGFREREYLIEFDHFSNIPKNFILWGLMNLNTLELVGKVNIF